MKLKFTFETMKLGSSIIAVPIGNNSEEFHGVIKLNEVALAILERLNDDITEDMIISSMLGEYNVPKDVLTKDVHECIQLFKEKGLLA